MKTCYCYETNKTYPCIKAFFQEENLPLNKYPRTTTTLRYSQVAEVEGYHIGYDENAVRAEAAEWRQPREGLDVEVNAKGEVRKKSTKLMKSPTYDQFGYLYIILKAADGSQRAYRVHRLVAEAFLPDYREDLVIDHLNGIRDDNRLENLAIKSQSENLQARDERNKPLYMELRRLVKTYGYDETLEILQRF